MYAPSPKRPAASTQAITYPSRLDLQLSHSEIDSASGETIAFAEGIVGELKRGAVYALLVDVVRAASLPWEGTQGVVAVLQAGQQPGVGLVRIIPPPGAQAAGKPLPMLEGKVELAVRNWVDSTKSTIDFNAALPDLRKLLL